MRRDILRETICVPSGKTGACAHATLVYNRKFLPLESAYPEHIIQRRAAGKHVGQIMLLSNSDCCPIAMFNIVRETWKRIKELQLDEVYIAIDPDDAARFKRLMFQDTNWGERLWDFADYSPVIVMVLVISYVDDKANRTIRKHFMKAIDDLGSEAFRS